MARCPAILIAGRMGARASVGRDEIRATPRDVFRLPCDDDRWDCFETREGPTRGRSANRACQLASSWSRNDHEDGGPTIQLPAAEARCTLRSQLRSVYAVTGSHQRGPIGVVLTSPTCRSLETVRFARLDSPTTVNELADGGQSMQGITEAQAAWLPARVTEAPPSGNTILVTHQPASRVRFPIGDPPSPMEKQSFFGRMGKVGPPSSEGARLKSGRVSGREATVPESSGSRLPTRRRSHRDRARAASPPKYRNLSGLPHHV